MSSRAPLCLRASLCELSQRSVNKKIRSPRIRAKLRLQHQLRLGSGRPKVDNLPPALCNAASGFVYGIFASEGMAPEHALRMTAFSTPELSMQRRRMAAIRP